MNGVGSGEPLSAEDHLMSGANMGSTALASNRRPLFAYAIGSGALLALSIGLTLLVRRIARAEVMPLLDAVTWAIALNATCSALIIVVVVKARWTKSLISTLRLDVATSSCSIALLAIAASTHAQVRLVGFGFTYAAIVAAKAALLTRLAIKNESQSPLVWHRAWVAAVGAVILVSTTGWTAKVSWPDGDGTAYLMVAHSILNDRDLDLRNNFARRDYLGFFPAEMPGKVFGQPLAARARGSQMAIAQDHHTVPGANGEELVRHDIGLSLVVLPGYAIAGRVGALIALNLIAVAAAFAVFEIALILGGLAGALHTWALFAFSAPVLAFSGEFFPEIAGTAVATWAAVLILRWSTSGRHSLLVLIGVLLGVLPWLCVRYWIIGGALCLVTLMLMVISTQSQAHSKRVIGLVALGGPGLISVVLFAWFDYVHFGTLLPNAGYISIVSQQPQFFRRGDIGLSGLLFDRGFGLLPVAPIYVFAAAGALILLRRQRRQAAVLLVPAACYAFFMAFSRYWYAGWTPPARYLVAALGLVAPAIAMVLQNRRARYGGLALGVWSWGIAICYVAVPVARFPSIIDFTRSGWQELVRRPGFDISVLFPSLVAASPADLGKLAAWAGMVSIGVGACFRATYRERPPFSALLDKQVKSGS
jgi:hypothetical protein